MSDLTDDQLEEIKVNVELLRMLFNIFRRLSLKLSCRVKCFQTILRYNKKCYKGLSIPLKTSENLKPENFYP